MTIPSARRKFRQVEPLFICLGMPKSATTWIHRQLETHPEISCTISKELNFWTDHYQRGPDWYVMQFAPGKGYKVYAEVTPHYLTEIVLQRMAEDLDDVLFMISLRNPYERAFSDYWDLVRNGAVKGTISEALEMYPRIIRNSCYGTKLKRYLKLFPLESLYLAFYEDLQSNPKLFLKGIYDFIGVDPDFVPNQVTTRVNVGRRYSFGDYFLGRSVKYTKMLGLKRRHLINMGLWTFIEKIYQCLARMRPVPAISQRELETLDPYLRPELAELEEILQRDFSNWLP